MRHHRPHEASYMYILNGVVGLEVLQTLLFITLNCNSEHIYLLAICLLNAANAESFPTQIKSCISIVRSEYIYEVRHIFTSDTTHVFMVMQSSSVIYIVAQFPIQLHESCTMDLCVVDGVDAIAQYVDVVSVVAGG